MLYKISALFFFISFFSQSYGEVKNLPNDEAIASIPTDLLPPSAAREKNSDTPPNLDLGEHVADLERRVERLEQLIEILRSSSNTDSVPSSNVSDQKENKKDNASIISEKDPVNEFERIKQLAVAKDSTIESAVVSFVEIHKDHPLAPKVYFFLADYYYSQKEYEKAINLIKEGLIKYKGSSEESRAIWILSLVLADMGKQNEACTALKKMLSLPPQSISVDLKENATKKYHSLNCQ